MKKILPVLFLAGLLILALTMNLTVFATPAPETYTLTYSAEKAAYPDVSDFVVPYTLHGTSPAKVMDLEKGAKVELEGRSEMAQLGLHLRGYKFVGWTEDDTWDPESDLAPYPKGYEFEIDEEDVTLYSVWELDETDYTVTYDLNGCVDEPPIDEGTYQSFQHITPVEHKDITFSRVGFKFLGWSLDPDATTEDDPHFNRTIAIEDDYIEDENMTLYAVWERIETYFNLFAAVTGETQATANYRAFAEVAFEEDYPEIARLFLATADAEEKHAADLWKILLGMGAAEADKPEALDPVDDLDIVGDTEANLQTAYEGEFGEYNEEDGTYPKFAKIAADEELATIAALFSRTGKVEEGHAKNFKDILDNLTDPEYITNKYSEIYRCLTCGEVTTELPTNCPVCHASGESFAVYGSTYANLFMSVKGETTAAAKYLDFAEKALAEGHIVIAQLFKATADAEQKHADDEWAILVNMDPTLTSEDKPAASEYEVGTTEENLLAAFNGETYEYTTMYPAFRAVASLENETAAAGIFRLAMRAEETHARNYKDVLDHLSDKAYINSTYASIYRCKTCGEIETTLPTNCPICHSTDFEPYTTTTYTLSLTAESGGTVSGDGEYARFDLVTITATDTADYRFVKWVLEDDEDDVELLSDTDHSTTFIMPNHAVTITAEFERVYTLTIDIDLEEGGTATGAGKYAEDEKVTITAEANPGYIFVDWDTEDDDIEILVDEEDGTTTFIMPDHDVTITALFRFVGIAPTIEGSATMSLTFGYAATSTAAFEIGGLPEPKVTIESSTTSITWNEVTQKLNIAAGLSANTYTVVLKATNDIEPDATFTFKLTVQSGGTINPGTTTDTTTNFTVTFNSNGGSTVASKTVASGAKVAKPADPTKDGSTFAGWYTDAALTTAYDFNASVTKSFTLYAKWTAVEIKPNTFPFADVPTTHWAYGHIKYVYDLNLMNGTGATTFSPNDQVTRAMVVTVLHRMEGEPQITEPAGFSDVKAGMWYTNGVAWGEANKIVEGYPGNVFRPDQNVSRQELATILLRYAKFIGKAQGSAGPNPDDPPDDETPDTVTTTTSTSNDLTFADAAKIADWAKEGVAFCAQNGIVEGRTGNIFDPTATATRAEFATMLHRFIEKFKNQLINRLYSKQHLN